MEVVSYIVKGARVSEIVDDGPLIWRRWIAPGPQTV